MKPHGGMRHRPCHTFHAVRWRHGALPLFVALLWLVTPVFLGGCARVDSGSGGSGSGGGGSDTTAPEDVTDFTATGGDAQITLTWTASISTDVDHYEISVVAGGSAKLHAKVFQKNVDADQTSATITLDDDGAALVNGTMYTATIKAVDGAGNKSSGVSDTAVPGDVTAPDDPSNFVAVGGDAQIDLSWTAPADSDLDHYNVYLDDGTGEDAGQQIAGTLTSATLTQDAAGGPIVNDTTYTIRITSVDDSNNESSGVSDTATPTDAVDTTAPDPPTNLQATPGDGKVTLSWTASTSSDVQEYRVYVDNTSTLTFPDPATDNGVTDDGFPKNDVTITVTGLTNGVEHDFRVLAVDFAMNIGDGADIEDIVPGDGNVTVTFFPRGGFYNGEFARPASMSALKFPNATGGVLVAVLGAASGTSLSGTIFFEVTEEGTNPSLSSNTVPYTAGDFASSATQIQVNAGDDVIFDTGLALTAGNEAGKNIMILSGSAVTAQGTVTTNTATTITTDLDLTAMKPGDRYVVWSASQAEPPVIVIPDPTAAGIIRAGNIVRAFFREEQGTPTVGIENNSRYKVFENDISAGGYPADSFKVVGGVIDFRRLHAAGIIRPDPAAGEPPHVVFYGGLDLSNNTGVLTTGEHYHPIQDDFSRPLTAFDTDNDPRYLAATLVVNTDPLSDNFEDHLLVTGGRSATGVNPANNDDSMDFYDINGDVVDSGTTLQNNRYAHTMTQLPDGRILVIGGIDGAFVPLTNDTVLADPAPSTTQVAVAGGVVASEVSLGDLIQTSSGFGVITAVTVQEGDTVITFSGSLSVEPAVGSDIDVFASVSNTTDLLTLGAGPSVVQADGPNLLGFARATAGRWGHTATLLADGRVLVVGGRYDYLPNDLSDFEFQMEIFDPVQNQFIFPVGYPSSNDTTTRFFHKAVLLQDNRVLICGGITNADGFRDGDGFDCVINNTIPHSGSILSSCVVFDPVTETTVSTGSMSTARVFHEATLLNDGRVLVTGGYEFNSGALVPVDSAELYDPVNGTWTAIGGGMIKARAGHSAILLDDDDESSTQDYEGQVLIVGGRSTSLPELFNPQTNAFLNIANTLFADHSFGTTSTLLQDGRVLIAGGMVDFSSCANEDGDTVLKIAEVFDPDTLRFDRISDMSTQRTRHTATLLDDGRVLIAGGEDSAVAGALSTCELYDPATDTFTDTGSMNRARFGHKAVKFLDATGADLVAVIGGGNDTDTALDSIEVFDPNTGTWSEVAQMSLARFAHDALLLPSDILSATFDSNTLLITGGGGIGGANDETVEYIDLVGTVTKEFKTVDGATAMNVGRDEHLMVRALNDDETGLVSGHDDDVLVLGGDVLDTRQEIRDASAGDEDADVWELLDDRTGIGRVDHTLTLLADGRVLAAGGDIFATAEIFTFDDTGSPENGVFDSYPQTHTTDAGTTFDTADGEDAGNPNQSLVDATHLGDPGDFTAYAMIRPGSVVRFGPTSANPGSSARIAAVVDGDTLTFNETLDNAVVNGDEYTIMIGLESPPSTNHTAVLLPNNMVLLVREHGAQIFFPNNN